MSREYLHVARTSRNWELTGRTVGGFVELAVKSRLGVNLRYVETDVFNDAKRYPCRMRIFRQEVLREEFGIDV